MGSNNEHSIIDVPLGWLSQVCAAEGGEIFVVAIIGTCTSYPVGQNLRVPMRSNTYLSSTCGLGDSLKFAVS